jgi:hypothetical protein
MFFLLLEGKDNQVVLRERCDNLCIHNKDLFSSKKDKYSHSVQYFWLYYNHVSFKLTSENNFMKNRRGCILKSYLCYRIELLQPKVLIEQQYSYGQSILLISLKWNWKRILLLERKPISTSFFVCPFLIVIHFHETLLLKVLYYYF